MSNDSVSLDTEQRSNGVITEFFFVLFAANARTSREVSENQKKIFSVKLRYSVAPCPGLQMPLQ
jgi:hypothetical protein